MRILFGSNYTAQSGYANIARMVVPRMNDMGHTAVVLELGVRGNRPTQIGNVHVYPPGLSPFGDDIVEAHSKTLGIDAVISLTDTWGLNGDAWGKTNWFPWTPIDHLPVPENVMGSIKSSRRPIAMTTFGFNQLKAHGLDPYYVPLCYDRDVFSPGDKGEARARMGLQQDGFLVVFVGVNDSVPSRKGIPELLAGWKLVSDGRPDWKLYMHTAPTGNMAISNSAGVDIKKIITTYGVDQSSVLFPDVYNYRTGIPQRVIADLYRAADLVILPSRGEGFGLPLIEAQACGSLVAATDFGATRELCFSDLLIEGEMEWTWQGATVVKPGSVSIAETIERASTMSRSEAEVFMVIERAREYEVDHVMQKYWRPVLTDMARMRLEGLCVSA